MRRATTPTHYFTLPSVASEYSDIHITYSQRGTKILEKNKSDLTIDGKKVSFTMTQQETKLFDSGVAYVQLRVLIDDTALASEIMTFKVNPVLCDDVLPISEVGNGEL